MVLAKDVYTPEGQVLLKVDTLLTPRYITKLQQFKIEMVWVTEVLPKGLSEEEYGQLVMEEEVKVAYHEAVEVVSRVFNDVRTGEALDVPAVRNTVTQLCASILRNDSLLRHVDKIYTYDDYTFAHSVQVCVFTLILAKALQYTEHQMINVGTGGLLHDIGKTRLPVDFLNTPRKYTPEEFEQVKEHARLGSEILMESNGVPLVAVRMAGEHHERYDGKGYYQGLQGGNIHPFSQITALADVYDAMTTDRAYRSALLPQQAIEYLLNSSGTAFNPEMCRLFVKSVAIFPIGTVVQLTNGLLATIVEVDAGIPYRPVVGVIDEPGGKVNNLIDLRARNDILIAKIMLPSEVVQLKYEVKPY